MLKWIGGIVSAVIIGTGTWWLTQGLRDDRHEVPTALYTLTGAWHYTASSTVSHSMFRGSMMLTQSDSNVTGVMTTADNSSSGLTGSLIGNALSLSRDTGLNTVQSYQLRKVANDRFSGTFRNVGQFPDSGTIELER
jgi:hypothetical protein